MNAAPERGAAKENEHNIYVRVKYIIKDVLH